MASPVWSNLNSRRSTRVLKLLPGQTADPLQIHLHEVNLDDKPSYHAISYTWGEEIYTQSVSINGVATDIRRNLFNFLLVLRNQLHTQDLWVDALSIRQDDLIEKGNQVQMIGEIFKNARRVLMWVGENADDSQALFQQRSGKQSKQSPEDEQLRLEAWSFFVQRRYFKRLWIIQELVVARDVVVYCGTSSVSWDALMTYRYKYFGERLNSIEWDDINMDQATRSLGAAFEASIRDLVNIIEMRKLYKSTSLLRSGVYRSKAHKNAVMLSNLSMVYRDHSCSDPRDYVFALFSLDGLQGLSSFQADYTVEAADLFVRFCVRKLASWPRTWSDHLVFNNLDSRLQKALFIVRLEHRMLKQVETLHQATRIALDTYGGKDLDREDRKALDILLAAFHSDRRTREFDDRFKDVRGCQSSHFRMLFKEIRRDGGLLWKAFEDAKRSLEF